MPISMTAALRVIYPNGFNRGFTETFARYGLLLDRLAMAQVNGFVYHQPQPFDMPGPDGPKSPEEIGAEFGRRAALAEESFATRRWRADLEMWDNECKPASIARHRELGDVDVASLTDGALVAHLDEIASHLDEMVYQHHRFNVAAMLPVGDLALHFARWAGQPPTAALGVLDGYSPISGLAPTEMDDVLAALRGDDSARALVTGTGDAAVRLDRLRADVAAVDEYVRSVQDRLVDGFDLTSPTLRERPELIVGKLAGALEADTDSPRARADELADRLRLEVPAEHQGEFDDLVAEARAVYRLRDERGLFSDVTAIGILRHAMLEVGHRTHQRGRLNEPEHIIDATVEEAKLLLSGQGPTAEELAERVETRRRLTAEGAPRYLGPPPPPHPPVDELPPALGRMMSSVGFMIESILGQLDESQGDDSAIIGIGVTDRVVEGPARLVSSIDDLLEVEPGDVIVAPATGEAFNSILHLVAGIVTDHGSHLCHAAIVAREMGFPAVVGSVDATKRIKTGDRVRLDGAKGEIIVLR